MTESDKRHAAVVEKWEESGGATKKLQRMEELKHNAELVQLTRYILNEVEDMIDEDSGQLGELYDTLKKTDESAVKFESNVRKLLYKRCALQSVRTRRTSTHCLRVCSERRSW